MIKFRNDQNSNFNFITCSKFYFSAIMLNFIRRPSRIIKSSVFIKRFNCFVQIINSTLKRIERKTKKLIKKYQRL